MSGTVFRRLPSLAATLLLAACSGADDSVQPPERSNEASRPSADLASPPATGADPQASAGGWDMLSSGEGVALQFPASGQTAIRLFCPAGKNRLLVNVPGFRPIGSEERLTFGSSGSAHALVADTRGDRLRGGVSGTGPLPGNLEALIAGPVLASYGAQASGPHPGVPQGLARSFAAACTDQQPRPAPLPVPSPAGACHMQNGQRLSVRPLRAVGTEPFWGARIEGRCVTYSHPDDQKGTRVWTRHSASGGGGTWTGSLGGRRFELRTQPQADCSDGMSDRRYPIAVELTVGGEQRRGCAEPL